MITDGLTEPVLCAVSGGVDSMYMLCRLRQMGYKVIAAHYNHKLRGEESERDADFVREFCDSQGIRCVVGQGDVAGYAAQSGQGIEEAARTLRYGFLEQTADALQCGCIATAHTADDNAETMLFHLTRGSGLRGLSGIPPRRGRIIRPILDVTRKEAEAWLDEQGIAHVEDSTNQRDDYARNRIRHSVTPVLESINPGFVENTARAAVLLRRDEEFLTGLAQKHLETWGNDAVKLAELPEPIGARAVKLLAGREMSAGHVAAVLHIAQAGGATDIPGMRVERRGSKLIFGGVEKAVLPEREVRLGKTELPECGMVLYCEQTADSAVNADTIHTFLFSYGNICGKISVTARQAGDRFRPAGRNCTKSLKQLFLEKGVDASRRDLWPVLRDEKGIIAVYGFGVDERVAVLPGEQDILKIQILSQEKKELT